MADTNDERFQMYADYMQSVGIVSHGTGFNCWEFCYNKKEEDYFWIADLANNEGKFDARVYRFKWEETSNGLPVLFEPQNKDGSCWSYHPKTFEQFKKNIDSVITLLNEYTVRMKKYKEKERLGKMNGDF